jgi:hypothetical protein
VSPGGAGLSVIGRSSPASDDESRTAGTHDPGVATEASDAVNDLRRDAAGRRKRRPVPGAVQAHEQVRGARLRDLFIIYSRDTGDSFWVYWAPFLLAGAAMLAGIPVYRSTRGHMTEPGPVPPYPTASPGH